jgi:small GTP-binding protein
MDDYKAIKIGLVGDANIGKSSLVSLISKEDLPKIYTPTIGVDLRVLYIEDKKLKLSFWDLSGHTLFKDLVDNFVKSMDVICFCFSCDNQSSYTYMCNLYNEYTENNILQNKLCILLLTKIDKLTDLNYKLLGIDFSREKHIPFFMTSSLQKIGCLDFLNYIIKFYSPVTEEKEQKPKNHNFECILS